jgi:hypothetical protein
VNRDEVAPQTTKNRLVTQFWDTEGVCVWRLVIERQNSWSNGRADFSQCTSCENSFLALVALLCEWTRPRVAIGLRFKWNIQYFSGQWRGKRWETVTKGDYPLESYERKKIRYCQTLAGHANFDSVKNVGLGIVRVANARGGTAMWQHFASGFNFLLLSGRIIWHSLYRRKADLQRSCSRQWRHILPHYMIRVLLLHMATHGLHWKTENWFRYRSLSLLHDSRCCQEEQWRCSYWNPAEHGNKPVFNVLGQNNNPVFLQSASY